MRKLIYTFAGAAALASASIANAAVTVASGTVVNLNDPNPSTTNPVNSVQTVGDTTTINFGLNPIVAGANNLFSSAFTINDTAAGIYSVNVGTSTPTGVTFTSGTLTDLLTSTVYNLVVTDAGLGLRLGPPFTGAVSLAPGNYRLAVNGTDTLQNGGSFAGTVTILTAAVPEPATWAMMLLGFGAIGLSMRKRRRPVLAQIA
jgi:hypothetical protein